MPAQGPLLPLSLGDAGASLIVAMKPEIKQNLKHLLLCEPGEHISYGELFGVGRRRQRFEHQSSVGEVGSKVYDQINRWMPYVTIRDLQINMDPDRNRANIVLKYSIKSLGVLDIINMSIVNLKVKDFKHFDPDHTPTVANDPYYNQIN